MNAPAGAFPTIEDLLERIAVLEADNDYLRSELGLAVTMTQVDRLRTTLPLTAKQGLLVLALYARKGLPLSRSQLEDRIGSEAEYSSNLIVTMVSHIRSRIGSHTIQTVRFGHVGGYALTTAGMEKVRDALGTEPEEPPPATPPPRGMRANVRLVSEG